MSSSYRPSGDINTLRRGGGGVMSCGSELGVVLAYVTIRPGVVAEAGAGSN